MQDIWFRNTWDDIASCNFLYKGQIYTLNISLFRGFLSYLLRFDPLTRHGRDRCESPFEVFSVLYGQYVFLHQFSVNMECNVSLSVYNLIINLSHEEQLALFLVLRVARYQRALTCTTLQGFYSVKLTLLLTEPIH